MGCEVHDYEYIRNHMDEYKYTMALVKKMLPDDTDNRVIYTAFYKKLLDDGEMSVPVRCKECPFHSIVFSPIGIVCDVCDINFDTYVGDMFFAQSRTRPKWCPI